MTKQIDFDIGNAELPIEFGRVKIIESSGQSDFVLTDQNESVLFGFDAEEAADILIVIEKLVAQVETEVEE